MSDPLLDTAMWSDWQSRVFHGLPDFAASPLYVEQDSLTVGEVNQAVASLKRIIDPNGMARDLAHGGRPFPTCVGVTTRMWVDANIEIDFLRRHVPDLASHHVLDIGAGYGRLAVMLSPLVASYVCVDPVPVSVEVCRHYTHQYAPSVRVLDVASFRAESHALHPTLGINIHSWNECSIPQITAWLDVLASLQVPWLFTVSHGQNPDACPSGKTAGGRKTEPSYTAWEAGGPSWRPLLEQRYTLAAEESIGISSHPHALWRAK